MYQWGKLAALCMPVLFVTLQAATAAEPVVLTRSVESGAETVVARSTFWNSDCSPVSVKVTITKPPSRGTATVREGANPVSANPRFGTSGQCVGKEVMGKQVVYRSPVGYKGEDVINYESVSAKGQKSNVVVNITVK